MLEGVAESVGMVAGFIGAIVVTHRAEIKAILERYKRKTPRHAPAVMAAPEYRGRHRLDDTQPWETRILEGNKEVDRVRMEPGKDGRPRLVSRRDAGDPAGAERGPRRAPGPARAPAGQARQRFARASARSERLMALR